MKKLSSQIYISINPENKELTEFASNIKISTAILQRLTSPNTRIEFIEENNYLFVILYIPEYNKEKKIIEPIEVNILFDSTDKIVYLFAYNSEYFFLKYSELLAKTAFKSLGSFLEKFLSIILLDEERIIEHILEDTNHIRREYYKGANNYTIIRHLTNNQINISSLNLVVSNQIKLIELVNEYITAHQQDALNYKKNYITAELKYASEFCDALKTSINTKFHVKSTFLLNRFTKYSFITFVASVILTLIIIYKEDVKEATDFFPIALFFVVLTTLLVLIAFRNKE